jgi:hypothetical protein
VISINPPGWSRAFALLRATTSQPFSLPIENRTQFMAPTLKSQSTRRIKGTDKTIQGSSPLDFTKQGGSYACYRPIHSRIVGSKSSFPQESSEQEIVDDPISEVETDASTLFWILHSSLQALTLRKLRSDIQWSIQLCFDKPEHHARTNQHV